MTPIPYLTLRGQTNCIQARYAFPIGNVIGMKGMVYYDPSCLIWWEPTQELNQMSEDFKCCQKTIGFTLGKTGILHTVDPHQNSIRLGFSGCNNENQKVYNRLYTYHKKVNSNLKLDKWLIADPLPYHVELNIPAKKLEFQIGSATGAIDYDMTGIARDAYMNYLYIEGTHGRVSPQDVSLRISNEWITVT